LLELITANFIKMTEDVATSRQLKYMHIILEKVLLDPNTIEI